MRLLGLSVVCLAIVAPLGAQQREEAAVRDVVARYMAARENGDAQALERLFTSDADQHTTAGEWRRGREAVVPGSLASSRRNAGTRTIRVQSVRFVTRDVAIADGPYEIAAAEGTRRMWTTIVLVRQGEEWRIAAIRNMLPTS